MPKKKVTIDIDAITGGARTSLLLLRHVILLYDWFACFLLFVVGPGRVDFLLRQRLLLLVFEQRILFVVFVDQLVEFPNLLGEQKIFWRCDGWSFVIDIEVRRVQFVQIFRLVVAIDLLLVDDALRNRQLGDLSLIDFLFHCAQGQKTVNVAWFRLAETIHTENTLNLRERKRNGMNMSDEMRIVC